MVSTKERKRALGQRIEHVTQPALLQTWLSAALGIDGQVNDAWESRVVQLDGTGAATIALAMDGRTQVFAKLYSDGSGQAIYEKLRALRAAGFGAGDRYQVVEPLGYLPEYGMLITRTAEGSLLADAIGADDQTLLAGVEDAARWLAKLHTTSLRIGTPRSLLEGSEVLSVARRMAKVAALHPTMVDQLVAMVHQMEHLAEGTVDGLLVQSHGQYRPIHVFLGASAVTVIDLDRSRPCDPARDVAEFLHRLRVTIFRMQGSAQGVDAATEAFLQTYAASVPDHVYLANLAFHWSRYVFHSLNKELKDSESDDFETDPAVRFYRSEFENVIAGRFSV